MMKRILIGLLATLVCGQALANTCTIRQAGATDQTVYVEFIDSTTGVPNSGLAYNTSGIDLEYVRTGAAAVDITEATQTASGAHSDGGFVSVGHGRYRLDLPDAAVAAGVPEVVVQGVITGYIMLPCVVALSPPVNSVALGGTSQTGRDIGASVLISSGTGTGQLSVTSGVISANVTQAGGSAISQSGGLLNANMTQVSADATAADTLETWLDGTAGSAIPLGIVDQGTAQSATSTTLVLRSALAMGDDTAIGMTVVACGSTQGYCQARSITDYVGSTDTATVETWTVTPSGTITYYLFGTAPSSGGGGGLDAAGVRAAIGMSSANLDTQLAAIDDYVDTEVAAIKTKTDFLPSATAGASGGLLIAGTNADFDVTANASFSGGVTITQSTSNTAALVVTGNGTGNGATITSGSGATGTGLAVVSAATNGTAMTLAGVGTGNGLTATGGATGHGISGVGGSTSGNGIRAAGTAGNSAAMNLVGQGSAAGLLSTGGATGAGISAVGGATSGSGFTAAASTSGTGITATGVGTSQAGIVATGGSTSSNGITATGGGTGSGIVATSGGGATGDGIRAVAASTNGNGLTAAKAGSGNDLNATSTPLTLAKTTNITGFNDIAATAVVSSGAITTSGGAVSTVTTTTNLTNAPTSGDFTSTMKTSIGTAVAASAVASVTGNVGGNVTGSVGSVATNGISAASLATDAGTELAAATWDLSTTGHTTGGTFGAAMNAAGSAGDPWGTSLPGAYTAGSAGYILGNMSGGGSGDWTSNEKTAIRSILGIPASGTTPDDPTTGILDTIRDSVVANSDTAGTTTLLSRLSSARAGYLDNLSAGAVALASALTTAQSDLTTLTGRLTSTRAGYLDNLSAGAVATASSISALNNLSSAQAQTAAAAALTAYDPPTRAEATTDANSILTAVAALNNLSANQIRDIVIEDQGGTVSLGCALAAIVSYAGGDVATSGSTSTYKDASNSETRITGTVTGAGNRNATLTCPTY